MTIAEHVCDLKPLYYGIQMDSNYQWFLLQTFDDEVFKVEKITKCPFCGRILNLGVDNNGN